MHATWSTAFDRRMEYRIRSGDTLVIEPGLPLRIACELTPWDGPNGEPDAELPGYLQATATGTIGGRRFRYRGIVAPDDLLIRDGAEFVFHPFAVEQLDPTRFVSLQHVFDNRERLDLIEAGTRERLTLHQKYMDTSFHLQATAAGLDVLCRVYDNSDFGDYRHIRYAKPLSEVLFLPAGSEIGDDDAEDWVPHGEPFIDLAWD